MNELTLYVVDYQKNLPCGSSPSVLSSGGREQLLSMSLPTRVQAVKHLIAHHEQVSTDHDLASSDIILRKGASLHVLHDLL